MQPSPPAGRVASAARRSRTFALFAVTSGLALGAGTSGDVTGGPGTTEVAPTTTRATTVPAAPLTGLAPVVVSDSLDEPVAVIAAPDGDGLWVAERTGRIVAVDPGAGPDAGAGSDGTAREPDVVLDLTDDVTVEGPEQGLLSVALHPGYPEQGGAFVYLVTAGDDDTEVREYQPIDGDPGRLDPDSAELVLAVEQPHEWHNGGNLLFGPDGYLYLGLGDGGGIADRYENAQDTGTILGGIVRLDVDAADPYAIPPDNPYVDGGGAPELWVHGLRNPWRTAIDDVTGTMVIADVGQDVWEEIHIAPLATAGGTNFGWPIVAGPGCFQLRADREEGLPEPDCDPTQFELPVLSLDRSDGCAVIGGPVYRGLAMPEFHGHYVLSDYCRGTFRTFDLADALAGNEIEQTEYLAGLGSITSIGTDHDGELYLTSQDGALIRIDPVRG